MNSKGLLFILSLDLYVVFSSGCARRPAAIEDLPVPDASVLIQKAAKNQARLKDLQASGIVEISGTSVQTAAFGLRMEQLPPDYLSLTLKGAMGIELGSLVLAGDQYRLDLQASGIDTSGYIGDFDLAATIGVSLKGEDMPELFQPLIPAPPPGDSLVLRTDVAAQQYILTWSDSGRIQQLRADPFRPLFIAELISSSRGDTLFYREAKNVRKHYGVFLPSSWTVQMGRGDEEVSIHVKLSQVQVNTGLTPTDFDIRGSDLSDSAEVRRDE